MDFKQAEVFLAVVEHGGLGRAATALRLTQSSVSQAIKGLERELKTPLFHRVAKGLILTPAGEAVVKPAGQILRDFATAQASVAEVSGPVPGTLELAAIPAVFEYPLVELIATFRRTHPAIRVRVDEADREEHLLRRVREGRAELGFCHLPREDSEFPLDMDELDTHLLGQTELRLIMPSSIDPDLPDPLPFAEIPDLPMIGAPEGLIARRAVEDALRANGVRRKMGVITSRRSMQTPLVLAGAGMAWTSRQSAELARARGAAARALDPPLLLQRGIVHRPGYLAPSARALLDLALRNPERLQDASDSTGLRSGGQ